MSRYLWEQKYGPIPEGKWLCHRCDNPQCINIDDPENHIFLGTPNDNSKDMVSKNRQAKGERQGSCKLTKEKVLAIRNEPITNISELSRKYGVSRTQIYRIKNRKKWNWL